MEKLYAEIQLTTDKRRKRLLEKKIEDLNKELQLKCGRSKEKAFLFEVSDVFLNEIILIYLNIVVFSNERSCRTFEIKSMSTSGTISRETR